MPWRKPRHRGAELSLSQNQRLLAYLRRDGDRSPDTENCSPEQVADPYYGLGCHPDLVRLLWDDLTIELPQDCRWVVAGTPVLVRPRCGVIFAFAGGTHTIGMRLPPTDHTTVQAAGASIRHAYSNGAVLDASTLGPEWVLMGWINEGAAWCRKAYDFAGLNERAIQEKRPGG